MKPWPVEFARMVFRCAIGTRWESVAWSRLMQSMDAAKRGGKR
jgi:hypothetical protein